MVMELDGETHHLTPSPELPELTVGGGWAQNGQRVVIGDVTWLIKSHAGYLYYLAWLMAFPCVMCVPV